MRTWQAVTKAAHTSPQRFRDLTARPVAIDGGSAATLPQEPMLTVFLRQVSTQAVSACRWLERKRTQQLASRRIRVSDTVSLGEKRFVSIVQVDGVQFLIGGSAGGVSLLAKLDRQEPTGVAEWCENTGASAEKDR